MSHSTQCPRCGKAKKVAFPLCYECNQKNTQKKSNQKMKPATVKLQQMVKQRKNPKQQNAIKDKPQSIKDWINTDVNEWDQLISEDNINSEERNNTHSYQRKQKKITYF